MATGMIIDGVAASEAIDSSGEILDVDGCDISSLESGDGLLNYEHRGEDSPGASAIDVVGRIVFAKKIFERSECDNDRQRKYWDAVKLPFIYIIGRLYDGADHPGAKALAAIIRDHYANEEPIQVRFSVEGSTLQKEGNTLKRSVARRVAMTLKPCNKSAISGLVEDPNAPEGFSKEPVQDKKDILADIGKAEHQHPMYTRLGGYVYQGTPLLEDDLAKAYTAGMASGAPSTLTGGAALQREDLGLRAKRAIKGYTKFGKDWKKAEFRAYMKNQLPEADDSFLDHFVDLVDDYRLKKAQESFGFADSPTEGASEKPKSPPKPRAKKAPKVDGSEALETGEDVANIDIADEDAREYEGRGLLTIRGNPVQPNPHIDAPYFDEETGILHTKRGSFPMYIPSRSSPADFESFKEILNDPKMSEFHNYAMENWARLHKLLKQGRMPPEIVMHATLFSQLSPNTPVPIQELMYAHLVDSMQAHGIDARDPEFASLRDDWMARDRGDWLPEHARGYFERLNSIRVGKPTGMRDLFSGKETFSGKGTYRTEPIPGEYPKRRLVLDPSGNPIPLREPGDVQSFMLANNKFNSMAAYGQLHDSLVDLVNRHRGDARSAVQELMAHKRANALWENKRAAAIRSGKPDPGPYTRGPAVQGLAPKTARYMWGMIGGGNVSVPDTHFARYLFGLDKETDADTITHIKNTLWDPNNTQVMNAIDRFYGEHHDAMKHMLQHPQYRHLFEKPEDAIFAAFWKNWLAINPHERARGFGNYKTSNERVDHTPFWLAVDPYAQATLIRSEADVAFAAKTAVQHAQWRDQYGEVPALLLYHRFIVPRLLDAAEQRQRMGVTLKAEDCFEQLYKKAVDEVEAVEQPDDDWVPNEEDGDVALRPDAPGFVEPQQVNYPAGEPPKLANPKVVPPKGNAVSLDSSGRLSLPVQGVVRPMHFPRNKHYSAILYPDRYNLPDSLREKYMQTVHAPWERAMSNWLRLNKALREGKLPRAVLKKAVLFSAMSPNTDVPVQEQHYGHLMDMINDGVLDLSKPIEQRHIEEFEARATSGELPRWNRSYYEAQGQNPFGAAKSNEPEEEAGELPQVLGLRNFDRLVPTLEDLVHTHKTDGRKMASILMDMKAKHQRLSTVQAADRRKGVEKVREPLDFESVRGYGPKLTRYALSMMGAGNIVVPDRHFIRSIFNESLDSPILPALTGVMKAHNEKLLGAIDQQFFARHPTVQYVRNKFPDHFEEDPEQAIFPAFWLHWLATPHYETALGRYNKAASNVGVDHQAFWDSIREVMLRHGVPIAEPEQDDSSFDFGANVEKSEGHPHDMLNRVVQAVEEIRQKHGEAAASFAFYLHALPALLSTEPLRSLEKADPEVLIRKFESMAIDLRKAAADAKAAMPRVVHFGSTQVVPGTAVVPHTGDEFALFQDRGDHYVGVPAAKAKNWEPEHLVRLSKVHSGKKFHVIRPPRNVSDTSVIDSTQHALPAFTRMREQHMLIHGVDTSNWGAREPRHASHGKGQWVKVGGGALAYAKESDGVRHEALYHDLAHEVFGLGAHVPLTAIFRHPKTGTVMSVQKAVVGARHPAYTINRAIGKQIPMGDEADVLRRLGDSGQLDKLAIMDAVMGMNDRHSANYVFTPRKGAELHLIDNENIFRPFQQDGFGRDDYFAGVPDYITHYGHLNNMKAAQLPIHPAAVSWTMGLDPGKLERAMHERGVRESRIIETMKRLARLQAVFKMNPPLTKRHIPLIAQG